MRNLAKSVDSFCPALFSLISFRIVEKSLYGSFSSHFLQDSKILRKRDLKGGSSRFASIPKTERSPHPFEQSVFSNSDFVTFLFISHDIC